MTHWLKEQNVNSNSYQRFMRMKGSWDGQSNQTYHAAVRYFLKEEQRRNTMKSTKREQNKKEKETKKKEMERILNMITEIGEDYDENGPVYSDCNEVRKQILAFLKRGIMSKTRFLKEIGNFQNVQYTRFASLGPLRLEGAAMKIYPKAYHWLEKLRIAEG